jgi:hypothetical protein
MPRIKSAFNLQTPLQSALHYEQKLHAEHKKTPCNRLRNERRGYTWLPSAPSRNRRDNTETDD